MNKAAQIIEKAIKIGVQISAAESCTGGLLMGALTEIAGASAVIDRGFITYSNAAKMQMLGVNEATLIAFGAVSEETAREMALGALKAAGADLAVSITGIAGPGGSEHKPEGRVCFALATPIGPPFSETVEFGPLGRKNLREKARDHALELVLDWLKQQKQP